MSSLGPIHKLQQGRIFTTNNMQPKIVTIANGICGGVYSITNEWEWDCLLTKLEAHCLQNVQTSKRCLSFASLPDEGIFTTVLCPVDFISIPLEVKEESTESQPDHWNTIMDDHSDFVGDDTGSLQSYHARRVRPLQVIGVASDFYHQRWEQARDWIRDDLWKLHLDYDNHDEIAEVCSQLAQDYLVFGNNTEALRMYRKSLVVRLMFLGKNHPTVSKTYNNIGTVHWILGEHEEARRMHQLALTTRLNAIEEQYSQAKDATGRWGEANLGEDMKSYPAFVQSHGMGTSQTNVPAGVIDSEFYKRNGTSIQDASEQSTSTQSPSLEHREDSINHATNSTMKLTCTSLRDSCKFQHQTLSYFIIQ